MFPVLLKSTFLGVIIPVIFAAEIIRPLLSQETNVGQSCQGCAPELSNVDFPEGNQFTAISRISLPFDVGSGRGSSSGTRSGHRFRKRLSMNSGEGAAEDGGDFDGHGGSPSGGAWEVGAGRSAGEAGGGSGSRGGAGRRAKGFFGKSAGGEDGGGGSILGDADESALGGSAGTPGHGISEGGSGEGTRGVLEP